MADRSDSLTDVAGIRVGHAVVPGGGSGCTVVLGPFRGAVRVGGPATGTRELQTLDPRHLVPRVDALLLTGGSAFGLAAAQGVAGWLEDEGRGFDTGAARVPIVPAAVIYDLASGRGRPGPDEGRRACHEASGEPVARGRLGAGAGATVGKALGVEAASTGGLGSASLPVGPWRAGALAVVNALGDVVDREGRVVAGARGPDGEFVDASARLLAEVKEGEFGQMRNAEPGRNTTLVVVATDAPASRVDLDWIAGMAATGVARRISPTHTPFDGDVTFAVTTSEDVGSLSPAELLSVGLAAREAVETAILRAVAGPRGA